jgi:hypothetical protein
MRYYAVYQYDNDDDRQIVAIWGVGITKAAAWASAEEEAVLGDNTDDDNMCLTECTEALYTRIMAHGDLNGDSLPEWLPLGILGTREELEAKQ